MYVCMNAYHRQNDAIPNPLSSYSSFHNYSHFVILVRWNFHSLQGPYHQHSLKLRKAV